MTLAGPYFCEHATEECNWIQASKHFGGGKYGGILARSGTQMLARNVSNLRNRAGRLALVGFWRDRKSTRLNSSHANISYAVFCLKKKKKKNSRNFIDNN